MNDAALVRGLVTVEGGCDGPIDRSSSAHMTVLRLSKATEVLSQLLNALPPCQFPEGDSVAGAADDAPATDDSAAA